MRRPLPPPPPPSRAVEWLRCGVWLLGALLLSITLATCTPPVVEVRVIEVHQLQLEPVMPPQSAPPPRGLDL